MGYWKWAQGLTVTYISRPDASGSIGACNPGQKRFQVIKNNASTPAPHPKNKAIILGLELIVYLSG